jgi:hypothetical protein
MSPIRNIHKQSDKINLLNYLQNCHKLHTFEDFFPTSNFARIHTILWVTSHLIHILIKSNSEKLNNFEIGLNQKFI